MGGTYFDCVTWWNCPLRYSSEHGLKRGGHVVLILLPVFSTDFGTRRNNLLLGEIGELQTSPHRQLLRMRVRSQEPSSQQRDEQRAQPQAWTLTNCATYPPCCCIPIPTVLHHASPQMLGKSAVFSS